MKSSADDTFLFLRRLEIAIESGIRLQKVGLTVAFRQQSQAEAEVIQIM